MANAYLAIYGYSMWSKQKDCSNIDYTVLKHEMVKVSLVDNLIFEIYLA